MFSFDVSYVHFVTIIVLVVFSELPSSTGVDDRYKTCASSLFSCGNNISNIGYPFWGDGRPMYCGLPDLQLQCFHGVLVDSTTVTMGLKAGALPYNVMSLKYFSSGVTLELGVPFELTCTSHSKDIGDIFKISTSVENITLLYKCASDIEEHNKHDNSVPCYQGRSKNNAYYVPNMSAHKNFTSCSSTEVLVSRTALDLYNKGEFTSLSQVFQQGFEVKYYFSRECIECKLSGGVCGSSNASYFVCLCNNGASEHVCENHLTGNRTLFLGIMGIGGGILILVVGIGVLRKRRSIPKFAVFWKSEAAKCANVDAFLHIYGSFALTSYTYANIKKMTNGFNDKVGEGGYATVYKGKLPTSGRLVAVKVLKQSKGDGEDFLNEVASISRTNHVNIVALLGFCYEGNKRALIYEFMSNGSLEKFTFHGNNDRIQTLPWETLFNIALGIGRGLDYLHRGCNARILHLDIKPHNILLDEEFRPKISDFGLAKLCPLQDSTISMLEARGTIGYIAPEVFCRTIGGVSHKSDVYSFGMMVLDMVCGRKNLSADLQRSSEVYFPQWIYNHLELEVETSFQGTANAEEKAVQKKMILVSLWCIQTYPENRPSMNRVVEMLQGCVESIQMPPKPKLVSPPRVVSDNSVSLTETIELQR